MKAKPKSKEARCSNRASPSAAETYEVPLGFGELPRLGAGRRLLYNFRSRGWQVRSKAEYGILFRKLEYWASDTSYSQSVYVIPLVIGCLNIQSSVLESSREIEGARICGNWDPMLGRESDSGQGKSCAVLTSRYIIYHPEHVWHNSHKYKVVEVEFGSTPFRRLCNWSAAVICLYTNPWNGIISLGSWRCRIYAGINHCLVRGRRRTRESGINRIESVNAPNIGEDAHRMYI